MILPVVKLGTLALRTICKPIASRLKKEAGRHARFRQFIINLAQANHRFTTNMQRRIYGHATNVEIRPLNEEKAVQAAADLLGELFVFSVAGAAVIFEVQRSSRSEARKEELRKRELEAIKQKNEDVARKVEVLKHKLHELESTSRGRGLAGIIDFRHSTATEASTRHNPIESCVQTGHKSAGAFVSPIHIHPVRSGWAMEHNRSALRLNYHSSDLFNHASLALCSFMGQFFLSEWESYVPFHFTVAQMTIQLNDLDLQI